MTFTRGNLPQAIQEKFHHIKMQLHKNKWDLDSQTFIYIHFFKHILFL